MKGIALLSLDNRPCNTYFPESVAKIAGWPFKAIRGTYSGIDQLYELAKTHPVLIVSLDRLCYGGLSASRLNATPFEMAKARLRTLIVLKRRNPQIRIHAFSVFPRLNPIEALPGTSRENLEWGAAVAQWAKTGPWDLDADGLVAGAPEEIEARLNKEQLGQYLEMRRRNIAVIREAIMLTAKDVIDSLTIFLDDNAPEGMHHEELKKLRREISDLNAAYDVTILSGTDEASMLLLSRTILTELDTDPPSIYPVFSSPEGAEMIGRYEDCFIRELISKQIALAGGSIALAKEEANIFLYVWAPCREQGEHVPDLELHYPQKLLDEFTMSLKDDLECGPIVALADVAYANGADPRLLETLVGDEMPLEFLDAFAAWNTAGNALGTAIAHAIARYIARHIEAGLTLRVWRATEFRHKEFLLERILDDGYYQAIVRSLLRNAFQSKYEKGIPRITPKMLTFARNRLREYAERVFAKHFRSRAFLPDEDISGFRFRKFEFPLQRDFEIDLRIKIGVRKNEEE